MGEWLEVVYVGESSEGPWAKLRRGHTEDTDKRPAVFYPHI